MVAKISVGNSLYGAIAYNGEKINEAQGRLLTTNRIYNDGSGTVDISKAMEGFHTFLPPQMKVEKPGLIVGTLNLRTHTAVVDIPFTASNYSILYRSSVNLNQQGDQIHSNYNGWVQNLDQAIRNQLQTT